MAASIKSIVKENQKTSVDTQAEVTRGAIISMSTAGVVIGLWSLACIAGAMMEAGGPFALVRAWFSAVTGM